ncbi:MFS transporter [Bacillus sp. 1780r2a1]|uniref:MFS transporter n=1 Tax=Priestia flexa TaxID=86664 RepID=UPI0021FED942|nr:MFS transporter [Priestia flexa]MDT2046171.1 MFS transporter [Priestia flexa]USY53804.1 MFS transporter [Bacillus sp. 1780r2a1]
MIYLLKVEKAYRSLFLAGIVNGVGDRFSQVALLALLLEYTESGLAVGTALGIRVLPFLFFGPLGGALADRFSKPMILIVTDLIRIPFALAFIWVNDSSMIWLVYVSTFVLAAGEAIYAPTRKALIPTVIHSNRIVKVNSLEQVLLGIVLVGGSLIGGFASFYIGSDVTFILNACSFLFASLIVYKLVDRGGQQVNSKPTESITISAVYSIITSSVALILVFCFELFVPIFNGIDNVLISVYAVQEFNIESWGVGLFYGGLGMGLMLSFIVANRIRKYLLICGLVSLGVEGIFLMMISNTYSWQLAFCFYLVLAFFSGISNACLDSVVMRVTPLQHQGKVFGMFTTISNVTLGLSMFGAGLLLTVIDSRTLGLIGGMGYVIISVGLVCIYIIRTLKQKKTPLI